MTIRSPAVRLEVRVVGAGRGVPPVPELLEQVPVNRGLDGLGDHARWFGATFGANSNGHVVGMETTYPVSSNEFLPF